ncbi:E3 ubiquitin-protein ligase NEURL3-like [Conger conger]|nr:E3 ubiquitin-protein ligase NEURL3-like [Conger conger]
MNREGPHTCGVFCLGPLAFHTEAVGDCITLTHGARCAERAPYTFRNGVVFSSRPVRVKEMVRLQVNHTVDRWTGALRLGFTTIKPVCGPGAEMAIPNLSEQPGYWAAPVPEECALPGYQLKFWATKKGKLMYKGQDGKKHKLLVGLDLSKPLWAMIDVYGQTCAVTLLGSTKKGPLGTRRSCQTYSCENSPPSSELFERNCPPITDNQWTEDFNTAESCVVCMSEPACVILCCGHQCLCTVCAERVTACFGTCPLCREGIT